MPMRDREVASILEQWSEQGLNDDQDEVSNRRQKIYDYYKQEPYGDEEEGYSSAVTGEVMETVEWSKPSLIRVFLTGTPVSFAPIGGEDRDAAKMETAAVNWVIREQNECFSEQSQWFTDALMYPNGYLKVWWDEREELTFEEYDGQTAEQVVMLVKDREAEIIEVEEDGSVQLPMMTEQGLMLQDFPTYEVKIRVTKTEGRIRYEATPPEEVQVASNCTSSNVDDADYVVHQPTHVTRSDLIAMGYDEDLVMSLETRDGDLSDSEKTARRNTVDENDGLEETKTDPMMEAVEYMEAYGRMDYDEDGYAERRKICKSGSTILENEYSDYQPFCALTSIIQSHRHLGMGLGEVAMQLQAQNSALTRQSLDKLYRTTRPRAFLGESINRDEFDNYIPHGGISGNPSDYAPEVLPSAQIDVLEFLKYQDERQASTTGISKHSMGLDAETLAQSTMGAYMEAAGQSSQRLELLIRTFAETGIKQMACKVHELLRKHQDSELMVELSGEWTAVQPREWDERKNMTVNVGMGTGSHRERAAASMQILELQREALPMGLTTPDRLYTTVEDLLAALGKSNPESYFVDPKSPEGQQIAQSMSQQAEEQAQQQEQMIASQVQTQMAAIQSQLQASMAKVMASVQKQQQDNQRQWAEMELDAAVDIIGKGVSAAEVVPMKKAGGGNDQP